MLINIQGLKTSAVAKSSLSSMLHDILLRTLPCDIVIQYNQLCAMQVPRDTGGVSAEVWSELAEFPGAIDGSTFDEFVSADDDVAIMGQLQDEHYVADVVPTTSQSDCNEEIDDGP
ncbi:hypothetical protein HPB50_011986 [Hyalomma asiaticum]|uniref:Uncharacterized protein n=1 Tax=Hyalomma asiaticum TaxID=266040 RepID=A0ACB7TF66_HYAAI|nr:hypothetical protein HPB50_011986 [Hyalomma asiaticum]